MAEMLSVNFVGKLSYQVGTAEPALRIVISLLLGYPIALLHRKIFYGKSAHIQYMYFTLTGLLLGYFNYGYDVVHCIAAVVFTYLNLLVFGGSSLSVVITFVFNMSYLLIGYHYSSTNEYDINWTVPHCVLVLRLIGIAFDLYDGKQPLEKLSLENKKVALSTCPGFLEFCGHMFFPTSFLIGPQFPIKRLQDFVNGKFGDKNDALQPPDSVPYALRRLSFAVIYLVIFHALGLLVSDEYMLSESFENLPFLNRLILLGVWGRYTLYKYISCWLFAEGGCILFGVTHNGEDENGKVMWNGLENVKLSTIENTTEFNHYIQSFNVNTNHWVAQYIYKRLKFLDSRYVSQGVALLFLATWHGFHTGYYVCFLFEFLVMFMEKDLQSIFKKDPAIMKFLQENVITALIIHLLLRLYTFIFMGWCLLPFVLLTFDKYWRAFGVVNYIGIILFGLWPILYRPLVRLLIGKKAPRQHTD